MSRWLFSAILFCLAPGLAVADDKKTIAPESFLGKDCVGYFRFDGVAGHQEAFDKSVLGQTLAGDLGEFAKHIGDLIHDATGPNEVKNKLFAGVPPDQLLATYQNAAQLPKLFRHVGQHGFVVGVEIIGMLPPRFQVTVIFPQGGAGANAETLLAGFRLLAATNDWKVAESKDGDRAYFTADMGGGGGGPVPVTWHWWRQGDHFVAVFGTEKPTFTVETLEGKRPNLTANALFRDVSSFQEYESLVRGFINFDHLWNRLGVMQPKVRVALDDAGIGGIQSIALHLGFARKAQRSTIRLAIKGERKGLLKALAPAKHIALDNLPRFAPDVKNVLALEINPLELYDGFQHTIEAIAAAENPRIAEEVRKSFDELNQLLGVDLRKDALEALGSRIIVANSPNEGLLGLGLAIAIEIKDPQKLQASYRTIMDSLAALLPARGNITQRKYHGVLIETMQFGTPVDFGFAPTFAIHENWLIFSVYPQTLQGIIMRKDGKYASWKPSPQMTELLAATAKKPGVKVLMIGEADSRAAISQLIGFLPTFVTGIAANSNLNLDLTLIPNPQAITERMFPNATVMVDEGNALRIDTHASLAIPFDPIGIETYWFGVFLAGIVR